MREEVTTRGGDRETLSHVLSLTPTAGIVVLAVSLIQGGK
jgi:hypothetical protein